MSMRLLDYFSDVTDPRVERTILHKLEGTIGITGILLEKFSSG